MLMKKIERDKNKSFWQPIFDIVFEAAQHINPSSGLCCDFFHPSWRVY